MLVCIGLLDAPQFWKFVRPHLSNSGVLILHDQLKYLSNCEKISTVFRRLSSLF